MARLKRGVASKEKGGALGELKRLYEFMKSHELDTLEIDEAGFHLRMARRKAQPAASVAFVEAPAAAAPARTSLASAPAAEAPKPGSLPIKATMMGIFYRAASPSAPPFAKEGDRVKTGQVLCMIEAMKVFNEVKAEFPCVIVKACLENGKPVKLGQDIFFVEKI